MLLRPGLLRVPVLRRASPVLARLARELPVLRGWSLRPALQRVLLQPVLRRPEPLPLKLLRPELRLQERRGLRELLLALRLKLRRLVLRQAQSPEQ
jgi:hypothetical protein